MTVILSNSSRGDYTLVSVLLKVEYLIEKDAYIKKFGAVPLNREITSGLSKTANSFLGFV